MQDNLNFYKNFDFDKAAKFINNAIKEDVGKGDITSNLLIAKQHNSTANLILKEPGVIAGLEIFKLVFKIIDPKIKISSQCPEGIFLNQCARIAVISGNTRNILKAERVSLNILQRLSGIATNTYLIKCKLKNKNIKIVDTRKTTPNFRQFEKLAVLIGGGDNHRMGLYDMILIKDNHIAANNGIENTLNILMNNKEIINVPVEIEVKNLEEFSIIRKYGKDVIDIVMLDNFPVNAVFKAVKMNTAKFKIEVSGGINSKNISEYGKIKGIDIISIGGLTHTIRSLDLSLDFIS